MSVSFKVVAVSKDDYEKVLYSASERQVHLTQGGMKERVSFTVGGAGYVLDPADYPEGTRFLLLWSNNE